jgi:predicted outer membrane repeat protein
LNGLSSLSVSNSKFYSNYANSNGGAIYASGYLHSEYVSTEFKNNYAGLKGSEYYALYSAYVSKFRKVEI